MSTVIGAARWKPLVAASDDVWRLRYTCPTCHQVGVLNLQPPPWSAPTADMFDDAGDLDEARRGRGQVEHEDVTVLETQAWCHRCGQGGAVRITE